MTATTSAPGALATGRRALAPDLARGAMLLLIALANSHYFLRGADPLGGFPRDGSGVDRAVTWALATFVDGRAFPMFGLLFGYGVARIAERQRGRGRWPVRRLLWRRSAALIGIGLVHGLLLYVGDILAAYGVLLLLGALMVNWKDRTLLIVAALVLALTAAPAALDAGGPTTAELPPDLATQLAERPVVQLFIMALGPIGFLCPFLLGLWAGRRRILEEPGRHRRLLRIVAVTGLSAAVLGAQPLALVVSEVRPLPAGGAADLLAPLHDVTGVLGGLGYAAAIALLADRRAARPGRLVGALAATGQRSMTCYLAQSVVWAVAFTPYLLDLSGRLSVTATAVLATLTWATTVALAELMHGQGRRGPFERLVRRITYGRSAAAR